MNIYLAADHGGFEYKKQLSVYLQQEGHQIVDCGNSELDAGDDYPDFVAKLAQKMLIDPESLGIVLCRNGVGVSIAANRYRHLRCCLGLNELQAKSARHDDNANVLAIAADYFDLEEIKKMASVFLDTPFGNLERYNRRLAKVDQLTNQA